MMTRIVLMVAALAGTTVLAGCGGAARSGTTVVAAFYPLAFAASEIGGAAVHVRNLTPAGAEPHDLELTAGDVRDVREADVVFYLGGGFMPALEQALESRVGPSVDLLAFPGLEPGPGPGAGAGAARDPHVWLDPLRYRTIARAVGTRLGRGRGAAAFARRLDVLDADFRTGLRTCARRQIVTSHAAFGYLARRYGLEQVPLEGLSPEAEPSPRALERLVRTVERSGSTTVFFEPLVSPKLAQTVARAAGVRTAVLDPLEGLTQDEVAAGKDYFSVMRENLAALRKALGCR